MKRCWILFILLSSIFLLPGCEDRQELERQAFIVAIGLDNGGKDNLVNVTFQISNPQVNTSQVADAQKEPPSDIVTVTAPDLFSAKELVQTSHSRKINFSHLQVIITGEDFAKTDRFSHIIGSAIIDPEIRRLSYLIVSKEEAKDFIHANKSQMETRPHKYYDFMEQRWISTGYVAPSHLNNLLQRSRDELVLAIYATTERDEHVELNEDSYLSGMVPQKSGDPAQMIGSAVLKNRKMIGTLNGEETRISLLLRSHSETKSIIASFTDPINNDYRISARLLRKRHTKIRINTKTDPALVSVEVPLKIQVSSNPALIDYTSTKEKQKKLTNSIETQLREEAMDLIKKLQEKYKSEPFVWHAEARKNFWTMDQFQKYDWDKQFQKAKVDIKFDITIENFGEQLKPPSIR